VLALPLNKRLRCQPVDTSYDRIVARSMLHAAGRAVLGLRDDRGQRCGAVGLVLATIKLG